MDPQTERWPHVDIVRDELRRLQAEQTAAAVKARAAHFAELKQAMSGYDKTRTRIEREKGKRDIRAYRRRERILRQTSVANLTKVMLEKGQQIIERLEQNGRPVTDR
ncbi:MAG: hypothetical protein EB066_09815 [Betaproteobacteria bacterium]|nr:hypothetical protein [Betaproteobacteria bacterium]